MANEAKLLIRLEAENKKLHRQLDTSAAKLKRWEGKAKKSVNNVGKAFAGLVSVGAILAIGNQIKNTIAQFEKMEASLKTVTGSSENAVKAMKQIQDFTSTTPFQISEVTQAFIKLKALGLKPSEEALRSYGNTSAAMGKSLNQMIEAVADAATGEFERLKEFGIKAKSQGDKVTFTFQGVATTVQKNAAEIEEYLQGIGNVQFAGAMDEQMDTIAGKTSNLNDVVDQLIVALGEAGLKQMFKDSLDDMIRWTKAIKDSKEAMDGLVESLSFLGKIMDTQSIIFTEASQALGAFADIAKAAFDLDFDRIKEILVQRDKEVDANLKVAKSIWAKVEAQKASTDEEEKSVTQPKGGPSQVGDAITAKQQKQRDAALKQIETLERTLADAETREALSWFRRQGMVDNALDVKAISEARHRDLTAELEQKHMDKMGKMALDHQAALGNIEAKAIIARRKFAEMNSAAQTKFVLGQITQLTAGVASSNKTMFKINKAAAIANAVINTYEGVSQSLKAYPMPLAAAMAAIHLAAGIAQVNNIRKTQFGASSASGSIGGGGSVPSLANSPGIPTTETAPQQGATTIQINAENIYGVEHLDDVIREAVRTGINDRDEILIDINSRNGQELISAASS